MLGISLSIGCAELNSPTPEPAVAPPTTPDTARTSTPIEVGTVTLVNSALGFVLIDTDMGFTPPKGMALKTFPAGVEPAPDAETSILTVSAERRPPFIAADIVKGEPQKGDAVFQ